MSCPNCEKKFSFKKTFFVLCILSISIFGLEAYASGTNDKMNHSKMNHGEKMKMKNTGRKVLDEKSRTEVLDALKLNESLQSAFFDYNPKQVEISAKKVKDAIKAISNTEISKLLKFAQSKLEDINSINSREQNNQNYHLASMALIHIVNTYDVGNEYNAYSCPMVKKKWLQNSKKMAKVNNPYAPNMPHCGGQDTSH